MKVKAKSKRVISLTLTEEEAHLLAGLAVFPDREAQIPEVAAFLAQLDDELERLDIWETAESAGFVDVTTLAEHI